MFVIVMTAQDGTMSVTGPFSTRQNADDMAHAVAARFHGSVAAIEVTPFEHVLIELFADVAEQEKGGSD